MLCVLFNRNKTMTLKQTFIITFGMAATLLVAGCSQEKFPDMPDDSGAQPLRITVTDGGYAADGASKNDTRAVENGYTTEFTAGDACGLYMVRSGGNVAYNNVKLTATAGKDGTLTWQPEEGVRGYTGETYFLYYPYQPDMTGKTDAASISNDANFFAPLISGWQPAADQSTYAKYTACDLMTAKGSATKNTDDGKLLLAFSMTHRMALAVIDVPRTVYRFTNTDVSISDYVVAPVDFTDSDVQPWHCGADGTYRCIVKPAGSTAVNITGSYNEGKKEFMTTPSNIAAGSYKCYVVDGAPVTTKEHSLQPGDYYLTDGHLLAKDATLTDEEKNKVIGIVFYAGHHPEDGSDYYYQTGIALVECHGYVIALKDASPGYGEWGKAWVDTRDGGVWSGYYKTHKNISESAGGVEKLNLSNYRALYYAVVSYEKACAAPVNNSSGWFLPSIEQWMEIYKRREIVSVSFSSLGSFPSGYYWPSETAYPTSSVNPSWQVDMTKGSWLWSGLNTFTCKVRSILAF